MECVSSWSARPGVEAWSYHLGIEFWHMVSFPGLPLQKSHPHRLSWVGFVARGKASREGRASYRGPLLATEVRETQGRTQRANFLETDLMMWLSHENSNSRAFLLCIQPCLVSKQQAPNRKSKSRGFCDNNIRSAMEKISLSWYIY